MYGTSPLPNPRPSPCSVLHSWGLTYMGCHNLQSKNQSSLLPSPNICPSRAHTGTVGCSWEAPGEEASQDLQWAEAFGMGIPRAWTGRLSEGRKVGTSGPCGVHM